MIAKMASSQNQYLIDIAETLENSMVMLQDRHLIVINIRPAFELNIANADLKL